MRRSVFTIVLLAAATYVLGAGVTSASADVNDFEFESFEADYYLGLDAEGRSTLTTVETLVAVFPDFDQNRGIIRALVKDYDGHPTDLDVTTVTDENGVPRPGHVADDDEGTGDDRFHEVVIAGDGYVHGRQTYAITYTQHNVTRYAADTGADEFYWDTNGTGWDQPFGRVMARVHVPAELADTFTGATSCYWGYEGATDSCVITTEEQPDGGLLVTAGADNLQARQNVTVALGFDPGTFEPRDSSFLASVFAWLEMLCLAAALAVLAWVIVLRATVLRDARGRPTIIAEYAPPRTATVLGATVLGETVLGAPVLASAVVLKRVTRATAAQIIDLAVRRNIRIIESEPTAWYTSKSVYTLELVGVDGLDGTERDFLRIFFGRSLVPGSRYRISKSDTSRGRAVYRLMESVKKSTIALGLRARIGWPVRVLPLLLSTLAAVGTVVFAVLTFEDARGGAIPLLLVVPAVLVELIAIRTVFRVPLTSRGAELRDHMRGLRLYIRLAEADRFRVLQSPEGAERVPVSTSDPRELVKLYERLLPYAVLFGEEKRWAEEIGRYYDDSPPDWYSGSGAFNAAIFAASIGSLSSSTSASYTGSSSSSSSGGSSGGGSSGGGGGGGGGGGV